MGAHELRRRRCCPTLEPVRRLQQAAWPYLTPTGRRGPCLLVGCPCFAEDARGRRAPPQPWPCAGRAGAGGRRREARHQPETEEGGGRAAEDGAPA